MKYDLEQFDADREISPDICIIGTGPAGMSLATGLQHSGLTVALLEGGGEQYEETSAALYAGTGSGDAFDSPTSAKTYVQHMRQRYYGGSSNCWAGWCVPLDPIDFEVRGWIPDSGWPISYEDLLPWWRIAESIVDIQPYDSYDIIDLRRQYAERLGTACAWFETHVLHCSRGRVRFAQKYGPEVAASKNISLFLHANVTDMRTGSDGTRIDSVEARSLGGRSLTVRPKITVVACGGIENARLLLCSDRKRSPDGLANQHGLVGRYFMEHLEMDRVGEVLLTRPGTPGDMFTRHKNEALNQVIYGCLCPTREAMQRHALNNCSIYFEKRMDRSKAPLSVADKAVLDTTPYVDSVEIHDEPHRHESLHYGHITVRTEQAPQAKNRVTLGSEVDALGQPRTHLHWEVSEFDHDAVYRNLELLAQDLGHASMGRMRINLLDQHPVKGGPHHMGTTRMAFSPRKGVVDDQCKAHGIDNLYLAGSSVFPTGGFANPTFTIVALARRLAAHLAKELKV